MEFKTVQGGEDTQVSPSWFCLQSAHGVAGTKGLSRCDRPKKDWAWNLYIFGTMEGGDKSEKGYLSGRALKSSLQ